MFPPGATSLLSRRFAAAALAVLAACATAPPPPAAIAHRHTATVTVTGAALLPAAKVEIPTFGTVVWRNRSGSPMQVEIASAICNACDTVLGFTQEPHSARSVIVQPEGVVTLCFHESGEHAFTVQIGDRQHVGTIHVGAAR